MNEFLFNTFTWTVIGFIVAYIAHIFNMDGKRNGIVSTVIFSLAGAFFGGFLANIFLGKTILGFSMPGIILAFLGVLVLAILQRFIFQKHKHTDDTFYYLN